MCRAATVFKLAALVCPDDCRHGDVADALIHEQYLDMQARGLDIRGLEQQHGSVQAGSASPMQLVDVATGQVFGISQDLGRMARGCRLDPAGLAQASGVLRRALDHDPDLVLVNRFGALEATGGGFVPELAALVERDIPVLTVVISKYRQAWRDFTGAQGQELPLCRRALRDWLAQHVERWEAS